MSASAQALREGEHITQRGLTGFVKWYDDKKGFGRIVSDEGLDLYVHHTGLNTSRARVDAAGRVIELLQDDQVKFDIAEGRRGPKCVNVELA